MFTTSVMIIWWKCIKIIDAKYLTLHNEHPHAKLMELEGNINHDYLPFNKEEWANK